MDKINKANIDELAKHDYEHERKRWDSEIRAERVILFLAGAVAGVLCAISIVR